MIILSATSMWLRNSSSSAISPVSEKPEFDFQRSFDCFRPYFFYFSNCSSPAKIRFVFSYHTQVKHSFVNLFVIYKILHASNWHQFPHLSQGSLFCQYHTCSLPRSCSYLHGILWHWPGLWCSQAQWMDPSLLSLYIWGGIPRWSTRLGRLEL